jgi:hypothetical protein
MLPGFAVRGFVQLLTPDNLRKITGPLTLLLICLFAGFVIYHWIKRLRRYAQNKEEFGFLRSFLGMFALFFIIHNVLFFAHWIYFDFEVDNDEAILGAGTTWAFAIPFFVFFGLICDLIYLNIRRKNI